MDPEISVPAELEDVPSEQGDTGGNLPPVAPAGQGGGPLGGTEQPRAVPPQDNWEMRFKGLQRTVQEKEERLRELQTQLLAYESQLFQLQLQSLPPEQQAAAWQAWTAQKEAEAREAELEERQREIVERDSQAAGALKFAVANIISTRYGVPLEKLLAFDSPQAMETYAADVAALRRQQQRTDRQRSGADRFEGGSAPAPGPKKRATTFDEAFDILRSLPVPTTR